MDNRRLKPCEFCGVQIKKEPNRNWNEYAKKRFCSRDCFAKGNTKKVSLICDNSLENLVVFCRPCHQDKHREYREEGFYEDLERDSAWSKG
jgi:hypothetical protein